VFSPGLASHFVLAPLELTLPHCVRSMSSTIFENIRTEPVALKAEVTVSDVLRIPYINSNMLATTRGIKGQIAFDVITNKTFECINQFPVTWRPIGGGGGGGSGTVLDYSLHRTAIQPVPSSTEVVLNTYSVVLPYFDNTGCWNTATGIYTADTPHSLTIIADIAWTAGINNQGSRHLRIYYKPFAGLEQIIKEDITQANPSQFEPTPQHATIGAYMSPGDQVYVKVFQDSGVGLSIDASGSYTGHRTNPTGP